MGPSRVVSSKDTTRKSSGRRLTFFRRARLGWRVERVPHKSGPEPHLKSVDEVAALLSRTSGMEITAAMIKADIKSGAPKGKGGKVHILNYAAWLAKELARDGDRLP